jgi:hypothetical protein
MLDPQWGSSPPAGREDEANMEKETGRRRGRRQCRRWWWHWWLVDMGELRFIGNTECKKGRSIDWCYFKH